MLQQPARYCDAILVAGICIQWLAALPASFARCCVGRSCSRLTVIRVFASSRAAVSHDPRFPIAGEYPENMMLIDVLRKGHEFHIEATTAEDFWRKAYSSSDAALNDLKEFGIDVRRI